MFVEVLDRHGDVRSRLRIEGEEFCIGRAYDNDLILDDPYVAPHHLRIRRLPDGSLHAQDLQTRNGLHDLANGRRETSLALDENARIRIGHTQLRFRSREFSVPEELPATLLPAPARSGLWFYIAFLVAAGLLGLEAHLSTFGEMRAVQLLTAVFAVLLSAFFWTGAWAFAGRIATRRANFHAHGTAVMIALAALVCAGTLSEYIEFMISGDLGALFLQAAIAGIVIGLLYRQMRLVSRISPRRALASAALLVTVLFGSGRLVEFATEETFASRLDYSGSLKAPLFRLTDGLTPVAFTERAAALRDELERLRSRP